MSITASAPPAPVAAPAPITHQAFRPLSMRDLMLHLAEAERVALIEFARR